jgi:hypothetical protein
MQQEWGKRNAYRELVGNSEIKETAKKTKT